MHNATLKILFFEMLKGLDNCEVRDMEKTQKYGPLMWELRERNPSHQVNQCNIIIDVLGGYSADASHALKEDQIHLTLCVVSKFLLKQRGLLLKCSFFFRKNYYGILKYLLKLSV